MDLSNQLLIAMPGLEDSFFKKSVVYVCDHTPDSVIGITINRPTDVMLSEIFMQMGLPFKQVPISPILAGGPVNPERGFVLHRPSKRWKGTLVENPILSLTTSRDVLDAMSKGKGPADPLFSLGYARWEGDQLFEEIANNDWLTTPANSDLIFDIPFHQRWEACFQKLGVNPSLLSTRAGHA